MKLNTTALLLLFSIFSNQMSYTQDNAKLCSCQLLKETEENDAKVIEMAEYIETSFHNIETKGFNEKFDIKSFINNITDNQEIDLDDQYTLGFMKGIEDTGSALSKKIANLIEAGAYYNLINYQYSAEDMAYYFTFRLYSEETGINYHDYKVCSDGETVKFNDIYIYLTGEAFSKTLQRIFLLSKPTENNVSKLFGAKPNNGILTIVEAKKLAEEGKYEEAYTKISQMKGALAKAKFTLIIKASYASGYDDKLYEETLVEFAELYPNDPTLYLKQIDYNVLKGDYDMAIENIDKLMFETNDDFLNLMKANAYLAKEDFKNAEKHYKYMTENYPDLLEGYVGYMVSLNFQNRFEDILNVVKNLLEQDYDKDALLEFLEEKEPDGSNALEAFVSSKVYKKWKLKS